MCVCGVVVVFFIAEPRLLQYVDILSSYDTDIYTKIKQNSTENAPHVDAAILD